MFSKRIFLNQVLPLSLTVVVASLLCVLLYGEIMLLNHFTSNDITSHIRLQDIFIGALIYLKTSIDFAIFMGGLMQQNRGWKSRIAIEIGTALGNGVGTLAVLIVWTFFKEIDWLLALMTLIAAIVLVRLAEDGLEHAKTDDRGYSPLFKHAIRYLERTLRFINTLTNPIVSRILPAGTMQSKEKVTFWSLLGFACIIPFVLGIDAFAGYVPLFSLVNVFGFCVGVFFAHATLNAFLYLSPELTIKVVKNPVMSFLGSLAFLVLAAWGVYEAVGLFFHLH
jgi:hypothetical protein